MAIYQTAIDIDIPEGESVLFVQFWYAPASHDRHGWDQEELEIISAQDADGDDHWNDLPFDIQSTIINHCRNDVGRINRNRMRREDEYVG